MNWLINLFGPIGERTKRILGVIAGVLVIVRPILSGELPQLSPDMPVVHLPWAGIPAAIPIVDYALVALGLLGIYAFVDKLTPTRNMMVFGKGTDPIVTTVSPAIEVVPVKASPEAK